MISYSTNVMGQYNLGTVATYTCNPGYELTGPGDEMRTCVDNGDGTGASFNGTASTCERKLLIIWHVDVFLAILYPAILGLLVYIKAGMQ